MTSKGKDMDAGRELDALIAEKVMGWRVGTHAEYLVQHDEYGEGNTGFDVAAITLPHYSTDIAAAWQVVERITRPPETLTEAERAANTRFGFWWRDADLWAYSSREAAHAICLAALRAKGIEL